MKIAIVGTAGVPAAYGGFETLAENIVTFNSSSRDPRYEITVFCSGAGAPVWRDAELVHLMLSANGIQSVAYDILSLIIAAARRADVILVLGVSGALFFPVLRLFSRAKIVVNVDGIEWRRQKWGPLASLFLKTSERIAVCFAHAVVADNLAVKRYLEDCYRVSCELIAYGGDHALAPPALPDASLCIPERFYFSVCRIEPENNVSMILEAFSRSPDKNVVFVGNWASSEYGRELKQKFAEAGNIRLLDPIYDVGILSYFRTNAIAYVHGHSAGGTNPALVEAMHFGRPVYAFDCCFNRETTGGCADYFRNVEELGRLLAKRTSPVDGDALRAIARRDFTWNHVATQYFDLFESLCSGH